MQRIIDVHGLLHHINEVP